MIEAGSGWVPSIGLPLALAAAIILITWRATVLVVGLLRRWAVLDRPNERSSHRIPTPRGGGIALIGVALPVMAGLLALNTPGDGGRWVVLGGALGLAVLSWLDDLRGLPATVRLIAHIVAVTAALSLVPDTLLVFQGLLPPIIDRVATGILWVWFINLFNFMDGIDGLSGVETVTIGTGVFTAALLIGSGTAVLLAGIWGLVLASAAAGFLIVNWHPARVFLGDVGSVTLGFLLGYLLIGLAFWGYWPAAVILPAYYLADATITISRRALRGAPIWRAHSEHFYQRAVQRGLDHGRVARFVAVGNAALLLLAIASLYVLDPLGDILCLVGAGLVVAVMLTWLGRAPAGQPAR